MFEFDYFGFSLQHGKDDTFSDLDKAMCFLSSKKFDKVRKIRDALSESFKISKHPGLCESEFFKIRYFKKRTVHLEFLDLKLWDKFNLQVAKTRNWLPDNK